VAVRNGYCDSEDVTRSLGELPMPPYLSVESFVADAADEMDSYIGFRYLTPIDPNAPTTTTPVKLLLKRINTALATGRIILAIDAAGENARLNARGQALVTSACEALTYISNGEQPLPNVPPSPDVPNTDTSWLPRIDNLDEESAVEAFYDRIANPAYVYYGQGYPSGRLIR
jgi:hypothetical protein